MSSARRSPPLVRLAAASLAAALLLAAPAAADVLVVDAAGGGEYTSLVEALAAAQDGDTLLLRPGDYTALFQEFVITDRSLTLAADGTGDVQIGGLRVVQNVAGMRVVLRGLRADTFPQIAGGYGLHVQGGEVFAEDCSFKGRDGGVAATNSAAVGVRVDSGHLVLARCTVEGGLGPSNAPFHGFPAFAGAAGLYVSAAARASVYGGTLTGGAGGNDQLGGTLGVGEAGGPGLFATNGLLFLAGTTVSGGAGGSGDGPPADPTDYAGGDAVHLDGVCDLAQLDVTLVPGAGGLFVGRGTGTAGDALDGPLSTVTTHPGPYRSYALGDPTPEGEALQLDYSGLPGDLLAIFVTPAPATLPLPAKQGLWHLGAPLFGPYVLSAPSGTLSLSIPIAGAGLGPEGAVLLYEQVFVKPASGPALLSSSSTHLIVDGSLSPD
ncbi:MAG TPA: hypothetical protein VFD43_01520 [Planctomycetota bacterium]|nr:hypothetical protein [Planctomycetota bacterium]